MLKIPPLLNSKCTSAPLPRLGKIAALAIGMAAVSTPVVHAGVVVDTNNLNASMTGQFNLGNGPIASTTTNGVIERASSPAAHNTNISEVRSLLNSGYNGGLWDGLGIMSGTAKDDAQINGVLAVMMYDNTLLGYSNFQGVTTLGSDPDFKQTLLRVTYAGDFDASGTVNGLDYGILDAYLGGGFIAQGDLNADNTINGLDYGIVDAVLGAQVYGALGGSVAPSPAGAAPVPEPTSVALLMVAALSTLGFHRKRAPHKANKS